MKDCSTALTKEILDNLELSKLEDSRREKIIALKDSIDARSEQSVLKFGEQASKRVQEINNNILSTIKVKDIPEIEELLPQLTDAFNEVDSGTLLQKKKGLFSRFFKTGSIQEFISKFESAENVVANIQKNLESVEIELHKDMAIEDGLGQKNIAYIGELDDCIFALGLKIAEESAELEELESTVDKEDIVAVQMLEQRKDEVDSLSKQQYWLSQQRLLAIQTLPILRNLKNNNRDMIRQINLTIKQSIPAWEQSIIIAFHIHRQEGAIRIEQAVHDMTNSVVKQNSLLIKQNSENIAKAVERGMIDIETFREANKNLIETSKKITEMKNTAMKTRQENMKEYEKLTQELMEAERRNVVQLMDAQMNKEIGE